MSKTHKVNTEIDARNKQLQSKLMVLNEAIINKQNELKIEENSLAHLKQEQNDMIKSTKALYDSQKEMSKTAFENYCQILENQYKIKIHHH